MNPDGPRETRDAPQLAECLPGSSGRANVERVLDERERCARHAEDAAANARQFGSEATAIICDAIASRIREGKA